MRWSIKPRKWLWIVSMLSLVLPVCLSTKRPLFKELSTLPWSNPLMSTPRQQHLVKQSSEFITVVDYVVIRANFRRDGLLPGALKESLFYDLISAFSHIFARSILFKERRPELNTDFIILLDIYIAHDFILPIDEFLLQLEKKAPLLVTEYFNATYPKAVFSALTRLVSYKPCSFDRLATLIDPHKMNFWTLDMLLRFLSRKTHEKKCKKNTISLIKQFLWYRTRGEVSFNDIFDLKKMERVAPQYADRNSPFYKYPGLLRLYGTESRRSYLDYIFRTESYETIAFVLNELKALPYELVLERRNYECKNGLIPLFRANDSLSSEEFFQILDYVVPHLVALPSGCIWRSNGLLGISKVVAGAVLSRMTPTQHDAQIEEEREAKDVGMNEKCSLRRHARCVKKWSGEEDSRDNHCPHSVMLFSADKGVEPFLSSKSEEQREKLPTNLFARIVFLDFDRQNANISLDISTEHFTTPYEYSSILSPQATCQAKELNSSILALVHSRIQQNKPIETTCFTHAVLHTSFLKEWDYAMLQDHEGFSKIPFNTEIQERVLQAISVYSPRQVEVLIRIKGVFAFLFSKSKYCKILHEGNIDSLLNSRLLDYQRESSLKHFKIAWRRLSKAIHRSSDPVGHLKKAVSLLSALPVEKGDLQSLPIALAHAISSYFPNHKTCDITKYIIQLFKKPYKPSVFTRIVSKFKF